MVLGGPSSHAAGGFKDQWRHHEYYARMGDTMYVPDWLDKDCKTWRMTTKPINQTMPGSITASMMKRMEPMHDFSGRSQRSMSAPRPISLSELHPGSRPGSAGSTGSGNYQEFPRQRPASQPSRSNGACGAGPGPRSPGGGGFPGREAGGNDSWSWCMSASHTSSQHGGRGPSLSIVSTPCSRLSNGGRSPAATGRGVDRSRSCGHLPKKETEVWPPAVAPQRMGNPAPAAL